MVSVGEVGQSRMMIYLVVTAILVINFVVLILVRRRMKRQLNQEMNTRVQTAVGQYFALSSISDAVV